jgi:hypothetical protein
MLAIIALGMVLAYVLPQRMRERTDYALVRTEDRYSADMRVVRSTAHRVDKPAARVASNSGKVPLLVTGTARASIVALGEDTMSRPAGPLDRAATAAQRQRLALHHDRSTVFNQRAMRARRRAVVAVAAAIVAITMWTLVVTVSVPAILGAIATAVVAGVVVAGARASAAQRDADARIRPVAREVEAAATATQALRRVARERAAGVDVEPSDVETQAIRVITAEDLAPLAAPAPVPAPALPGRDTESTPWNPSAMPAPAYTLKASVKPQRARPLSDDDFAASARAAERAADKRAVRRPPAAEASPTTGALDAILARRRRASA